MRQIANFIPFLALFGLVGCISDAQLSKKIEKVIGEHPEIVVKSIEKNPAMYVEAFQKAVKDAQGDLRKKREIEEKKKLEAMYDKPLKPVIRKDELFRGSKDGVLTLVEYSDFECPFCSRGFNTVLDLLKKYDGKIRFVYKHLPLSFHPNAMNASKYYEAARLQSHAKAIKFHDEIYKNQKKLKKGEAFLKSIARKVGLNMSKLKKDINSAQVMNRIKEDMAEAAKFGFQGTPGFSLNGIPVKGAYPVSHFNTIIEELKKRGKVKL